MKRKTLTLALILWLAVSTLASIEFINLTKANAIPLPERLPINQAYIRSNGDIDPPTLPIQRSGNTYVLKENIVNYSFAIEKDGVVFDGNGFSLTIPAYGEKGQDGQIKSVPALIQVTNRTDVVLKNFKMYNCGLPISIINSSNINVIQNNLTSCKWIYISRATSCIIQKNFMKDNFDYAMMVYESTQIDIKYNQMLGSSWHAIVGDISNSSIIGNIFVGITDGAALSQIGSFNRIIGNLFKDNEFGILSYQENNEIHHNNFINNREDIAINAPNILDDGKEGNYWSGYIVYDANQDGIGDTPLVIPSIFIRDNDSNTDHFPRKLPYALESEPPVVEVISPKNQTYPSGNITLVFTLSETPSRTAYCLDGNERIMVFGDTNLTGLSEGTHNLTVYAEDVFGNEGISETIVFNVGNENLENFPMALIVAVSVPVAVVGLGLLVYFKRRNH